MAPKPLTPEIEDVQSDKEDVQEADEKADISKSVTTEGDTVQKFYCIVIFVTLMFELAGNIDSGRENVELEELVNEEKTLLVQQDELCQLAGELKRKIENERSEVGRLRTKMQELRILYRYHSLSCDSAENSSDEDCSDSVSFILRMYCFYEEFEWNLDLETSGGRR